MSKTLQNLIRKADRTGKAVLNGRKVEADYGFRSVGDLEEKYAVEYDGRRVQLRHWGTELITINHTTRQYDVNSLYAESKSDIEAINYFCDHYEIDLHAHYYPSKVEAHFHNGNDELVKIV